ncbi:MAG: hypothetical protein AAF622_13285 [Cyanobacteria bacterium P01_C01_bin.147]
MSEGKVPPRSHDADSLASAQDQLPLQPAHPSVTDDWEAVPLPGMPPLSSPVLTEQPSKPSIKDWAIDQDLASHKEAELHSRISDLNQCNEVLLSRVNQLEESLERSQQALQQEVERSQRLTEEEKVTAAQTRSVAQLLSELDDANAALKRQTLLAETLAAQLKTAEERAQRLEQECTILRKRKAERAQQLQAAEDTCVDLRSRLQRQQQYTLQFKSALEKCLDTAAFQHTSHSIESDLEPSEALASEVGAAPANTIGMPRSGSIRPWSANLTQVPPDPQLQSLMPPPVVIEPSTTPASAAQLSFPEPASTADAPEAKPVAPIFAIEDTPASESQATANSEAEQKLWQDAERVIENTLTETPSTSPEPKDRVIAPAAPITAATAVHEPDSPTAEFTEPIPWGAPVNPPVSEPQAPDAEVPKPQISIVDDAEKPLISERLDQAPQKAVAPPAEALSAAAVVGAANPTIPALDAMQATQHSPSPLVHPLRPPQRKRKSLSAVELPSFPPLPKVPTD